MNFLPSHHYQFSALLTALSSLSLVVLVLRTGINLKLKKYFSLYYSALFLWSLSVFISTSFYSYHIAFIFNQSTHIAAALIPVFFLHFTYVYLGKTGTLYAKVAIFLFYVVAIFFISVIIFYPTLFFNGISRKLSFPYFPNAGLLYTPWVLSFAMAVLFAHAELFVAIKEATGIYKKRLKFFTIANLLGYSGGVGCFLPVYNLDFFPFPYGPYGVFLLSLVSGYTLLKLKFLNLEIVLKKTVVFSSLFIAIVSIFSFTVLIFQYVLKDIVAQNPFLATGIAVFIIVLIYEPIRKFLVNLTDRYLFQKKYNYHKLLKENSKQIAFIHGLDELAKQVVGFLIRQGRVRNAALFTHTERRLFELRYPLGYGGKLKRPSLELAEDHAVIRLLMERQTPLVLEEIDKEMKQSLDQEKKARLAQAQQLMKQIRAEVLIPSFLSAPNGEEESDTNRDRLFPLRTILVLGPKKSDESYSEEDLDVFYTVAQDSAIAAENARLLDVLVAEKASKVEVQKKAEMVNYAHTIAHEVKNALVGITGSVGFFERFLIKDLEAIAQQVETGNDPVTGKKLAKVINQITAKTRTIKGSGEKIEIIAATATGTLKGDESEKEEIYFPILWDQAKQDAHLIESGVQIHRTTPDNFRVYGNIVLLSRVFVNLLTNSRDAMKEMKEKQIGLAGSYRRVGEQLVCWIEYTDKGGGIPDAVADKIFDQGFSTKPKPASYLALDSGHGQGLYVCRKTIEEFHQGKIWVDKTYKHGAKFIFWLPVGTLSIREEDILKETIESRP